MRTALYLRKSRAEELSDSVEETLRKHKEILQEYAEKKGLEVICVYEEVVSGESLYSRPQMLRLLTDVGSGCYDAVLCMDIDRLGRGAMSDQGVILETFKRSNTKIITPRKIYDLNNEADEEYTEFETFMARRELKIIKRRMQRGVRKSIEEGAYLAFAPYGYTNTVINKRPTLAVNEEEAPFVRMIFDMYVNLGMGCQSIAEAINAMGAKPHRSSAFCRNSIRHILKNPVFIGKIVWNRNKHVPGASKRDGKTVTVGNPPEKWIVVDGMHPAIVEEALFYGAQKILAGRYHPPYYTGALESPLAGVVRCRICGATMQRRPWRKGTAGLLCPTKGCVKSARLDLVEKALLCAIKEQLASLVVEQHADPSESLRRQKALRTVERERSALLRQKSRLQDLLESGTYDTQTYLARLAALEDKINGVEKAHESALQSVQAQKLPQAVKIKSVLEAYSLADAEEKNRILKSVVAQVLYYKAKDWKPNQFELAVTLRDFG